MSSLGASPKITAVLVIGVVVFVAVSSIPSRDTPPPTSAPTSPPSETEATSPRRVVQPPATRPVDTDPPTTPPPPMPPPATPPPTTASTTTTTVTTTTTTPAPTTTTTAPPTAPVNPITASPSAERNGSKAVRAPLRPCRLPGVERSGDTPLVELKKRAGAPAPAKVCGDPDPQLGYGWKFVEYQPSALETNWSRVSKPIEKTDTLCSTWRDQFGAVGVKMMATLHMYQAALKVSTESFCKDTAAIKKLEPEPFDHDIFSRFKYVYECVSPPCDVLPAGAPAVGSVRYSYIEPLVAIMRHPAMCDGGPHSTLFDTSYILFDRWSILAPNANRKKVIYVDAGATVWNDFQHWFYARYLELCAPFSDVWGWEIRQLNPNDVWGVVPGHIRPRYRWYNVALKVEPESWDNPNNVILSQAKPEDVVFLKVDFDAPKIEDALLQQILEHPSLAALVDELLLEHHIDMEIMRNYWASGGTGVYLSDSLKLFTALRSRGIRAHSWV